MHGMNLGVRRVIAIGKKYKIVGHDEYCNQTNHLLTSSSPEGEIVEVVRIHEKTLENRVTKQQENVAYVKTKHANSYGVFFSWLQPIEDEGPKLCSCDITVLMTSGCKCKGI